MNKTIGLLLSGIGIILGIMITIQLSRPAQRPKPLLEPAQNPYLKSTAASGIVEALGDNIAIGVPTPGLVTKVFVKVWDRVEKDQPLFQLDDRELRAQEELQKPKIKRAEANLARLEDQLARLKSNGDTEVLREANIKTAEANLQRLKDQLARMKSVDDPRAVNQDDLRTRENDVAVAEAQLQAAKATRSDETRDREKDVLVAKSELEVAKAELLQTQTLIKRLTICAPQTGVVLQVNSHAGEYASITPKQPAIIMGNLDKLCVRIDVDERAASRIHSGQVATASLKGDHSFSIPLTFVRIEPFVVPKESLTGLSGERVDTRVLRIIYSFEQPKDRHVYVGQQLDVFIKQAVEKL